MGEELRSKYGSQPSDYSITAYDAALIIIDAIKRTAESGKAVNRSNVRDAIQSANLKTLQVSCHSTRTATKDRTVSVFQYRKSAQFAEDDILHQQHYEGVAPQTELIGKMNGGREGGAASSTTHSTKSTRNAPGIWQPSTQSQF